MFRAQAPYPTRTSRPPLLTPTRLPRVFCGSFCPHSPIHHFSFLISHFSSALTPYTLITFFLFNSHSLPFPFILLISSIHALHHRHVDRPLSSIY
ncbi:hypothetical protein VNO78_23174 [Psophocarpus tetragonolobus]|uniref:Uncharacterized protein n=1 Tax=Psophocarpus tetragonolobus TaxID=3891 RepID=A0AAN9S321_PSOTE